ncbi:MAG: hypothetical protein O7H39_13575 [Gammaproteobacteria bacterium]|nr:hypothetical protein [Gammaproteobacteria bacterium]
MLTGTGSEGHLSSNVAAILEDPLPREIVSRLDTISGEIDSISGN